MWDWEDADGKEKGNMKDLTSALRSMQASTFAVSGLVSALTGNHFKTTFDFDPERLGISMRKTDEEKGFEVFRSLSWSDINRSDRPMIETAILEMKAELLRVHADAKL